MAVTYFRRYRMRYDLREGPLADFETPVNYLLEPWSPRLLEDHAMAKYRSFQSEMDSNVFPCLGDEDGCVKLMKEISCRQGFVPSATWLARFTDPETGAVENCGTIQGITDQVDVGSVQNIGIVPNHRSRGLGRCLLNQSLLGFAKVGIKFVTLEVTSHNTGALRLYEKMGFRVVRTVYKSIDLAYG